MPAPPEVAAPIGAVRRPAPPRPAESVRRERLPRPGRIGVERVLTARRPGSLPVERVRERLPRPGTLAVPARGGAAGRTEDGTIHISDGVVAKLASRAALEVDDAGAAAPRLLGQDVSRAGLGRLGVRRTALDALPRTHATVDGARAFVRLTISVRYPAPVPHVAREVRERVQERVRQLTGLEVSEVEITVTALATELPKPARVV